MCFLSALSRRGLALSSLFALGLGANDAEPFLFSRRATGSARSLRKSGRFSFSGFRCVSWIAQLQSPPCHDSCHLKSGASVVIRLREKWLLYAALGALLLVLVGIKVTAGKGLWSTTVLHPANPDSNPGFNDEYVQGSPTVVS